jgi:NDP-sugar pyrophosphorylase family protein
MDHITQAFVLGAGLGTRLRPLTDNLPKPLVPIFQKPLTTFAFDHLIDTGIEKFFVNTHRLPEQFIETFAGSIYRDRPIEFLHEPDLLETGGGIKNAEAWLKKEPFLVYSGDILTDIDLQVLTEEHFRAGNDITLALRKTDLGAGVVLRNGRIIDITNKHDPAENYDYANVSVWNAAIFDRIPTRTKISFIPILVEWIRQGGRIGGLVMNDGKWFNIGSRAQYLQVHRTILEQSWKPAYVKTPDWPLRVAKSAVVDPSAQLHGCTVVGRDCRVGAETILEDTILWPGAQIASKSHLQGCIVRSRQKTGGFHRDIDI